MGERASQSTVSTVQSSAASSGPVVGTLQCCPKDLSKLKTTIASHYKLDKQLECMSHTMEIRRNEKGHFWRGGAIKRGVTRAIKSLLPLDAANADCATTNPYEGHREKCEVYESQGAPADAHSGCRAAMTSAIHVLTRTQRAPYVLADLLRGSAHHNEFAKAHGRLVDYQFECFVKMDWSEFCNACPTIDPCVATGLEVIKRRRWVLVAAQVCIYNAATNLATAIDLIATDQKSSGKGASKKARKTEKVARLHLIEIKARSSCNDVDAYYYGLGKVKTGPFADERLAYYTIDQTQLLFMRETVHFMCTVRYGKDIPEGRPNATRNVRFATATVLRIQPGLARWFDLSTSIVSRYDAILRAMETANLIPRRLTAVIAAPPPIVCQRCELEIPDDVGAFVCEWCMDIFCRHCEASAKCVHCGFRSCKSCGIDDPEDLFCESCESRLLNAD